MTDLFYSFYMKEEEKGPVRGGRREGQERRPGRLRRGAGEGELGTPGGRSGKAGGPGGRARRGCPAGTVG